MLVGKDHVGGKGSSCWWERSMLALQDDEECGTVDFAPKNQLFSQNGLPCVRSQRKLQQTICQLAPDLLTNVPRPKIQVDVEIRGKL